MRPRCPLPKPSTGDGGYLTPSPKFRPRFPYHPITPSPITPVKGVAAEMLEDEAGDAADEAVGLVLGPEAGIGAILDDDAGDIAHAAGNTRELKSLRSARKSY